MCAKMGSITANPTSKPIIREEIEKRMDELARELAATHDPKIIEEIYRLAKQLEEIEKQGKD
jgi:hypothetical protein